MWVELLVYGHGCVYSLCECATNRFIIFNMHSSYWGHLLVQRQHLVVTLLTPLSSVISFRSHLLWYPLDRLSHICWPFAFLLPGCLLLDVSGGCATLSHAGGGFWERVLPQKVLLFVWILLPCTGGGHLCSHRLQELWDQESVRVKTGLLHLQIEKQDYAIPPSGSVICNAVRAALAPPCRREFLNT